MQSKIANKQIKTIKPSFITAMKYDKGLKAKLAEHNERSVFTIECWLRDENPILTTATNLAIIKDHFGLLEGTEVLEVKPASPKSNTGRSNVKANQ